MPSIQHTINISMAPSERDLTNYRKQQISSLSKIEKNYGSNLTDRILGRGDLLSAINDNFNKAGLTTGERGFAHWTYANFTKMSKAYGGHTDRIDIKKMDNVHQQPTGLI
jgi:hypothetical protein